MRKAERCFPLFFVLLLLSLSALTVPVHAETPATLVFHVCDDGTNSIPYPSDTYNNICARTGGAFNILFQPEYFGYADWAATLQWLQTNFTGVPIMLDVFAGGNESSPLLMLTTDQISAAMAACNVEYLRISEIVTWYQGHSQAFPTSYVSGILSFARAHNLTVFWSEWDEYAFTTVQTQISGYSDIVTVAFQTNSNNAYPSDGFKLVKDTFLHWGASVQAWYWTTTTGQDVMNMPIALLVQHAKTAQSMGAEVLQLEPYWYFFDNGTANGNLIQLLNGLSLSGTSSLAATIAQIESMVLQFYPAIIAIAIVSVCLGLIKRYTR